MNIDLLSDPYYDNSYTELYLNGEGSLFEFNYTEDDFSFKTIAIKRPIVDIGSVKLKEIYYDLETPYGYGGYFINTDNTAFLQRALKAYDKQCIKENIIADFIRFHPFYTHTEQFKDYLDFFSLDRLTIFVDNSPSKEDRWKTYSKKVRSKLRKCEKFLTFDESDDLDTFLKLYYATMDRNRADSFYYFDKTYFKRLFDLPYSRLLSVSDDEEIVSMSFMLIGKDIAHAHLSANLTDKLNLNANYFLLDKLFDFARNEGCRFSFLGGGRSNAVDDSLLRFKQQFSNQTIPFYIAGKVHNRKVYDMYCNIWEKENPEINVNYFLKYRIKGIDNA